MLVSDIFWFAVQRLAGDLDRDEDDDGNHTGRPEGRAIVSPRSGPKNIEIDGDTMYVVCTDIFAVGPCVARLRRTTPRCVVAQVALSL